MSPINYKKAGVNTGLSDSFVDYIRSKAPGIGGFAGLFPLDIAACKAGKYSLVACTDGVGTKLKLAFLLDSHETVGIDLVAMCANDLITCGARPLFFLDYYATGKLSLGRSRRILSGIIRGCRQAGLALLGGETAEMPGFYGRGEYDLAGFSVGIVKNSDVIDGSLIRPGDGVCGLLSSGFHSNGFSLIRKIAGGRLLKKWGRRLLTPTRIYVPDIEKLQKAFRKNGRRILGLAHITGGGLIENVPRMLPKGCGVHLNVNSWERPPLMEEIGRLGRVPDREMWRTFNMGIGMVIIIHRSSLKLAFKTLPGIKLIGEVVKGKQEVVLQ